MYSCMHACKYVSIWYVCLEVPSCTLPPHPCHSPLRTCTSASHDSNSPTTTSKLHPHLNFPPIHHPHTPFTDPPCHPHIVLLYLIPYHPSHYPNLILSTHTHYHHNSTPFLLPNLPIIPVASQILLLTPILHLLNCFLKLPTPDNFQSAHLYCHPTLFTQSPFLICQPLSQPPNLSTSHFLPYPTPNAYLFTLHTTSSLPLPTQSLLSFQHLSPSTISGNRA